MKILIGYDGSECADAAIDDLKRAGLPEKTEAIVVSVADVREIPMPAFFLDRVSTPAEQAGEELLGNVSKHQEQAQEIALSAAKKIQKMFSSWVILTESVSGKPAAELIKMADTLQPDLLIVGSHGRSTIGRWVLGSVSQKVLNEAHCSVRISRQSQTAENGNVRILAAVDGSQYAEAAVKAIAKRPWNETTEVRLIAVDDPFSRPEAGYMVWNVEEDKPEDSEDSREWIKKVIDEPRQILESAGLRVSHNIRWGDAANMILEEAKDWKPDAIFVGARGLGRIKRFLLGSVSTAVSARAACSVEVVRS